MAISIPDPVIQLESEYEYKDGGDYCEYVVSVVIGEVALMTRGYSDREDVHAAHPALYAYDLADAERKTLNEFGTRLAALLGGR